MAPRLPGRGKGKLHLSSAPPREITEGDNSRAIEEGERVQLISFVGRLSQADDAIELAKAPLKAAQKSRSQIVGLAKAAGFSAKELERRLEEMRTPTRVMAEQTKRETTHRRWLGIISSDQADLLNGDRAPQEAKDEAHWRGEGYKAGLRQLSSTAPKECHERFCQAYMQEHDRGLKEVLTANAPKPMGPTPAELAARDFGEDNPDIDVEAAARKLKKDAAFMNRDPIPEIVDEDPLGVSDGFEATPEELAQQVLRPKPDDEVV